MQEPMNTVESGTRPLVVRPDTVKGDEAGTPGTAVRPFHEVSRNAHPTPQAPPDPEYRQPDHSE